MVELRDYQKQALEKILWAKQNNLQGNSICVLPTGAGKSIVIANLASTVQEPILILQPTKEILEQNHSKLTHYVPATEIGVYSASMNERTIRHFTFATIGSIYKKPELFSHFKLVIIDECHLVNPRREGSMYTTFLNEIGKPVCIGFTATPYRMDTKYLPVAGATDKYSALKATVVTRLINRLPPNKDKEFFWSRLLFNIGVEDLIQQGYLCPLIYEDFSVIQHDEIPVNKSESDFDLEKYEEKIVSKKELIRNAIRYAEECSKSVLVFCSSVGQAEQLAEETPEAAVVSAKTPSAEREQIVQDFKSFKIKTVFNVGVFSIGFDHPGLNCILLLRPTRSIGLYYQMVGRGLRQSPGKIFCRIIDLTSTVKNLGRVETIKLVKKERWELESETGSWHNKELYSYRIERKPKQEEIKLPT